MKRLAINHMTSTAAGHAVHAIATRKTMRARTATASATRGKREVSAKKKYDPYMSSARD